MKTRYFALAAALVAALTAPASADTITLNNPTGGITQKIYYNGPGSNDISGNVGGGPFNWKVGAVSSGMTGLTAGASVQTWCVDLFNGIASGTQYTITGVNNLPNATTIKNLFGEAYKVGGVVANPAAFQLALWELRYDSSPGSLTSGNFKYTGSDASVLAAAQSLLSQALYDTSKGIDAFSKYLNGYSLYLLDSSSKQDQLLLVPPPPTKPDSNPVPAPPAALLAVFGVVAFGGRAAWFRKKASA